jgi:hypothetical protein
MLTWTRIQSLYEPIPDRHARAAQLAGLSCPPAVFTALFHGRHDDADLEWLLRGVDFSQVTWEQEERSGVALRQVSVDRAFQEAVDEAYRDIVDTEVIHEREDVVASWRETGTAIPKPTSAPRGNRVCAHPPDAMRAHQPRQAQHDPGAHQAEQARHMRQGEQRIHPWLSIPSLAVAIIERQRSEETLRSASIMIMGLPLAMFSV